MTANTLSLQWTQKRTRANFCNGDAIAAKADSDSDMPQNSSFTGESKSHKPLRTNYKKKQTGATTEKTAPSKRN